MGPLGLGVAGLLGLLLGVGIVWRIMRGRVQSVAAARTATIASEQAISNFRSWIGPSGSCRGRILRDLKIFLEPGVVTRPAR